MKKLKGIKYKIEKEYSLFTIDEFSDEIANAIRAQFSEICWGEDDANSGKSIYNYHSTIKEFLIRYDSKSEEIKVGMIGEILMHIIIRNYYDNYKVISPFFNITERSIKKGYDLVLTDNDNTNIWVLEVKSGNVQKNKSVTETMSDLISLANNDLKSRLIDENLSLWKTAINEAKLAISSSNSGKEAILELLHKYADEANNGKYISENKNVFLNGVVFANSNNQVDENMIRRKQQKLNSKRYYNSVYVISVQKKSIEKVYNFLKSELNIK